MEKSAKGVFVESNQWYMEYKIHKNRPGLLGDIASVLGMLEVNILTINGVEGQTRGIFAGNG